MSEQDHSTALSQRLQAIAVHVREANPPFADAVDNLVDRLLVAEAGAHAPAIGEKLAPFILPDQQARLVSLDQFLSEGPVVVAFLRGHWCPYCQTTAAALAAMSGAISGLGARIVAITPDRPAFSREFKTQGAYPVLTDIDNGYALSLNLAIWVDDPMADLIAGAGIDLPTYQGNDAWILPIPAMFVLNRQGVIVERHVNADYRERADLDAVIAAVRALG